MAWKKFGLRWFEYSETLMSSCQGADCLYLNRLEYSPSEVLRPLSRINRRHSTGELLTLHLSSKRRKVQSGQQNCQYPPPSKQLSLILPEIAQGDALVVEEVEHKNILIVSVALCLHFSSTIASCPWQQGDIITVGKFGLPEQFEIWVILWDEELAE